MRTRRLLVITALAALLLASSGLARASGCPATPQPDCRVAGKTRIAMRSDPSNRAADALQWTWSKGQATLRGAFGSPPDGTGTLLCVYDAGGLVLSAGVPGGGTCTGAPCWARKDDGFRYADPTGASDGVVSVTLKGRAVNAKAQLKAKHAATPDAPLPLAPPVVAQLVNDANDVCLGSTFSGGAITRNDATQFRAATYAVPPTDVAPGPSAACGSPTTRYAVGTNTDSLIHDGITRTFGVYLPPSYDVAGGTATPVVVVLHGGFGSGAQVFGNAQLAALADAEDIVVVYPDGAAGPSGFRAWNAGGCCGYPVSAGIDDVGFIASMLDTVEASVCVDRHRIYATGMSNGAMLAHRLACELSNRFAAIGPVAGTDMTGACEPTRPVPVMHVHGTADMNVRYFGGLGCGAAGVPMTSVPDTIDRWVERNQCRGATADSLVEGDGTCQRHGACPSGADVVLCTIAGGGHAWPGGLPTAIDGLPGCPFGAQSTTFHATQNLWSFFAAHPFR